MFVRFNLDSIEFTFDNLEFGNTFCTSNTIHDCGTSLLPSPNPIHSIQDLTLLPYDCHYRLSALSSSGIVRRLLSLLCSDVNDSIRFDSIPLLSIRSLEIIDRIESNFEDSDRDRIESNRSHKNQDRIVDITAAMQRMVTFV